MIRSLPSVLVLSGGLAACGGDDERLPAPDAAPDAPAMAAVVSVEMAGTLRLAPGAAADVIAEITAESLTPRAQALLDWAARLQAAQSANLAAYIYMIPVDIPGWELRLGDRSVDGAWVVVPWTLSGAIHVGPGEPTEALAAVGGMARYDIPVSADPRHMLPAIGRACANEFTVPPNNVTDENYHKFFDGTMPGCVDALMLGPGLETVTVVARREPDAPAPPPADGRTRGAADLIVDGERLADEWSIVWRTFAPGDCDITEGCVGGPGKRRLLMFNLTTANVGDQDAFLGDPNLPENQGRFEFSECHGHFHFASYARFGLEQDGTEVLAGHKNGFCLMDSRRRIDEPGTPWELGYPVSCVWQGVTRGWEDEYFPGLDCQWLDITDLAPGAYDLVTEVNFEEELCEGMLVDGVCTQKPEALANNALAQVRLELTEGRTSMTDPCRVPDFGPDRNCGWSVAEEVTCTGGMPVAQPMRAGLSRVCEGREPCVRVDALAVAEDAAFSFTCPPSGAALVLTAPHWQ